MAEDYGNGKDFSPEHMHKTVDDAAYAAYAATYTANAAAYATYTANAAAYAAYAAYHAAYHTAHSAAYAAYHAAYTAATYADYYKPLLFDLIESRLSKLEKILIFQ
jgi:hypothetical protein